MQYDLIIRLVDNWEQLTIELVENIEHWRRAGCPRDIDRYFECSEGYVPDEVLYKWTMYIGSVIVADHLPLETSPLFEFGLAVRGWLTSRTGETLPPPAQLDLLHRRCLMIVHAVAVNAVRQGSKPSPTLILGGKVIERTKSSLDERETRSKAVTTDSHEADPQFNLTPVRYRILKVVASSRRRMTKRKIVEVMTTADAGTSEHTVRIELSKMVGAR
jgi:hypothetical protein